MIEKTIYKVVKPKGDLLKKDPTKATEVMVHIIETETKTREVNLDALDSAIDMSKNAVIRYNKDIKSLEKDIERFEKERELVKQKLERSLNVIIKERTNEIIKSK